jgi:hypothetical protein
LGIPPAIRHGWVPFPLPDLEQTALHKRPDQAFKTKLQSATKETYTRHASKKARYRPNYKDKPSAGKPVVRNARPWHRARLKQCFSSAA